MDPPAGAGSLARIRAGEIGGVILEEVLPPEACAAWAARLDEGAVPVAPTRFAAEFEAYSFGPCLDQCEGDLDAYLSRVDPFERALSGALAGMDLLERLLSALAGLAGDRPIVRPTSADGRRYGLATLRRLPPGGRIPPHCENEQLPRRSYDELRPLIDTAALLSFYVTVRPAERGGALSIHAMGEGDIRRTRHGHSDMEAEVDRSERVDVVPPPGAMIVFDGGRWFHQVRPVEGDRARWTLGGFLAPSRDGGSFLAWA